MAELKITKKMLKKKVRITPYAVICGLILLAYSFILLYPMYFGLINSFKHIDEYYINPMGLPDLSYFQAEVSTYKLSDGSYAKGLFANYIIMLDKIDYTYSTAYFTNLSTDATYAGWNSNDLGMSGFNVLLTFLLNTAWTTIAGSVVPIYLCAMMGYLCAKYKYKFTGLIYGIVIFKISCPITGGGTSMLAMMRLFGFYDSVIGYFLYNFQFGSMYFLIMFGLFQSLPDSYMEAAEIDGASQFRILTTIAIPLAGTAITAALVVSILTCWNDYNTPLLYLPSYPTIAFGIYDYTRRNTTFASYPPLKISTTMFLIIPSLIFFISLRKKLMGNLSAGGIKG